MCPVITSHSTAFCDAVEERFKEPVRTQDPWASFFGDKVRMSARLGRETHETMLSALLAKTQLAEAADRLLTSLRSSLLETLPRLLCALHLPARPGGLLIFLSSHLPAYSSTSTQVFVHLFISLSIQLFVHPSVHQCVCASPNLFA